jgi:hypothetical protein
MIPDLWNSFTFNLHRNFGFAAEVILGLTNKDFGDA